MVQDRADFVVDVVIAGDDDVCMGTGWIDVLFCHRQYRGRVLFKNAFAGTAALLDIAFYATLEAYLFSQIDIDFGPRKLPDLFPVESEQSFDDDEWSRFDALGLRLPGMSREVIYRLVDRFTIRELLDMLDEQRGIERVGRIEILMGSLDNGHMRQIGIVGIEMEIRRFEFLAKMPGKIALAGTRRSCDSDNVG